MRIRTITCHDCYNHGASLQAYALMHYLKSIGHDTKIIHYRPEYISKYIGLWVVANERFNKPIIKWIYLLLKFPSRLKSKKRLDKFDDFTANCLDLTKRYNSIDELNADPPEADVYIAGSDQIWNTFFPNGRDTAFYLDFGKPEVKRISYAASFATPDIVPEYREFVKKKIQNLDACSIREKTSLPLLRSLGREDGVAVCDPVFLLNKQEWCDILSTETTVSKLSAATNSEKYILVYLTDRSPQIEKIALETKVATGWKIFIVGALFENYADKCFANAGPWEFVYLIKNAQFVISNSFHATAFSLIMEKKFCVVNRSEGINERMKSVLSDFKLEEKLISTFSESLLKDIDYIEVNQKMGEIIKGSKKWLSQVLSA